MSRTDPRPFGLILAGGRSSRMGLDQPKPRLAVGGRSMARHVADRLRPHVGRLLVATDRPDLYADLDSDCLPDDVAGYAGPLAGLQAGARHVLRTAGTDGAGLVAAPADTPFLPRDLVPRLLAEAEPGTVAVAAFEGRLHPVCAYWPPSALERLDALHLDAARVPSLQSVLRDHGFVAVTFPPSDDAPGGDPFFNVNTPSELDTAHRFALSRG